MPIFLDTRGKSTLGIGICSRCSTKLSLTELFPDPNSPGLMCCLQDLDAFDPYRLAPRSPDEINLPFCRPDVDISSSGPSPNLIAAPLDGTITQIDYRTTWQPNTPYLRSAAVTPQDIDNEAVSLPQQWMVCLVGGTSGANPPVWPTSQGQTVMDNGIKWLFYYGVYLT